MRILLKKFKKSYCESNMKAIKKEIKLGKKYENIGEYKNLITTETQFNAKLRIQGKCVSTKSIAETKELTKIPCMLTLDKMLIVLLCIIYSLKICYTDRIRPYVLLYTPTTFSEPTLIIKFFKSIIGYCSKYSQYLVRFSQLTTQTSGSKRTNA